MSENFALKGNICYSKDPKTLVTQENGYLVCENGLSSGVFPVLPEKYKGLPLVDYGDCVIVPGLIDLHIHAPQFAFRGLGMDLELLDWLNAHTFPEESKYTDIDYAEKAYSIFVSELKRGPGTRACIFATPHTEATLRLQEQLEASGLVAMVGKVNMDRNCPDALREKSSGHAFEDTRAWIEASKKFKNIYPILTPRFMPACSDGLMRKIKELQLEYKLPVQSHLSESESEIAWVKELCPDVKNYGEAYNQFGLFGGEGVPAIMAHCVWSDDAETELMLKNGVYIAHCPQSNANLSSGIAPVRRYLDKGLRVGLGSDVAGGCHPSIFRAMSDAVQVSKLSWRYLGQNDPPLTMREAFYLGTLGGGGFFGKVGGFGEDYEFDAVVIDDSNLETTVPLSLEDRLNRIVYLSDDRNIRAKYVRGCQIKK